MGIVISCCAFSFTGSILVFGGVGGSGGPSVPPSCGKNVKGTPKILTYSGTNNPSKPTSYSVLRNPRPTTCSHKSWLLNARRPMMCVTVFASHPSESIPTEMTFCICSPGWPIRPTVLTIFRNSSACCFFVCFFSLGASSSSPFSFTASTSTSIG